MAAIVYWGEDAGGSNFLFFIFSKIGVKNWLGNYFGKVGFGLLAYWEYIEPNFLVPPQLWTVSEKIRGTKLSIVHCLGLLIRCETKRPFLWIKSCIQQLLKIVKNNEDEVDDNRKNGRVYNCSSINEIQRNFHWFIGVITWPPKTWPLDWLWLIKASVTSHYFLHKLQLDSCVFFSGPVEGKWSVMPVERTILNNEVIRFLSMFIFLPLTIGCSLFAFMWPSQVSLPTCCWQFMLN